MSIPTSIYIHYPFCKAKCPYCDFNSHVAKVDEYDIWLQAYLKELNHFRKISGKRKIKSIFFGGGTPSLMPSKIAESIITEIAKIYDLQKNAEITLEANPTSSEAEKFKAFNLAGINRLSIGIQSLNDTHLKFLGREHSALEAKQTIKMAEKYFDNFSFDLIYARPKQNLKTWQQELTEALSFNTPHLSLYQLTIEKGTKFYKEFQDKKFTLPSQEIQDDLYKATNEVCSKYGLEKYEISNYAKPGFESVHNLNYWQYGDYIGIGAGAHSRITTNNTKHAYMTHHLPSKWLEQAKQQGHAVQSKRALSKKEMLEELLMFGLRTNQGINLNLFPKYIKQTHQEIFGKKLEQLTDKKMLNLTNTHLQSTEAGKKVLNSLLAYLI